MLSMCGVNGVNGYKQTKQCNFSHCVHFMYVSCVQYHMVCTQ